MKLVTVKSYSELPCKDQATDQVKAWTMNAGLKVGDQVGVREGYGGTYRYYLVKLVAVDHTKQRRLVVDRSFTYTGKSYYRNGKNCKHPTGQTMLVATTSEVVTAANEDWHVVMFI